MNCPFFADVINLVFTPAVSSSSVAKDLGGSFFLT